MKLDEFPTNDDVSEYDWEAVFDRSRVEAEYLADDKLPFQKCFAPVPADVKSVHLFHGESPDGYGSINIYALLELVSGMWAVLEAWADTTGWGCKDGVMFRICRTRELALKFGASEEFRGKFKVDPDAIITNLVYLPNTDRDLSKTKLTTFKRGR